MTVLGAIGTFVVFLAGVVVGDLVSEEVRDRLDALPHALLRLAARRVPVELRADRLAEWTGELHEFLRGSQARPVSRLVRGIRYAVGLLHVASAIGRAVATTARATPVQAIGRACRSVMSVLRRMDEDFLLLAVVAVGGLVTFFGMSGAAWLIGTVTGIGFSNSFMALGAVPGLGLIAWNLVDLWRQAKDSRQPGRGRQIPRTDVPGRAFSPDR